MNRCREIANQLQMKVYLFLYDDRLNRVTEYQSELGFNWEKCHELLESTKHVGPRVKMARRTYVGNELKDYITNDWKSKREREPIPDKMKNRST